MKKVLFVFTLLFCTVSVCYADVVLDISGSQFETRSPDTIRIRDVVVPGWPGKYWGDFKWNPATLNMTVVDYGEESSVAASPGVWAGIVSYFVSADGSKITKSGSPLQVNSTTAAVRIGPFSDTWCSNSLKDYYYVLTGDIPITNNEFKYSDNGITISGRFTAKYEAIGTYSIAMYYMSYNCVVKHEGTWNASH